MPQTRTQKKASNINDSPSKFEHSNIQTATIFLQIDFLNCGLQNRLEHNYTFTMICNLV